MSSKETGGSAFPIQASEYGGHGSDGGMSLRDYFAAKAMQGMVVAEFQSTFSSEHWAEYAYKMADAMLAERAK